MIDGHTTRHEMSVDRLKVQCVCCSAESVKRVPCHQYSPPTVSGYWKPPYVTQHRLKVPNQREHGKKEGAEIAVDCVAVFLPLYFCQSMSSELWFLH